MIATSLSWWLLPTVIFWLYACGICGQVTSFRRVIWRAPEPVSYADEFPVAPKQLSVKIEMVLPEDKLVEEFFMYWDEELNLTRYDFALGRIMAPFNMTRPMKTIHDLGNGIAFFIDGTLTNCSMYPLGYLLTDQNSTGSNDLRSYMFPKRFLSAGNLTLHHLLRTLHPKQLFSMDNSSRVLNKTMETIRGIPCDVWEVTMDKYFVPGYGVVKSMHRLYFMSKDFARYLVGEVQYRIPVQRAIYLVSSLGNLATAMRAPRIILNFFDFTVPPVPTLYDFSISSCIPKGKLETRESIQIRFPGNFTGLRADQFIQPFRRKVLQRIVKTGDISPVRAIGMYFSQDITNMYITATILPRPPVLLHYTLIQTGARQYVTRIPTGLPSITGLQIGDLTIEQLSSCAANCDRNSNSCNKFGWCARTEGLAFSRRCILGFEAIDSTVPPPLGSDVFVCDVYQRIINSSIYDGGVVETLFRVLVDIQDGNFTINIANNVTEVSVSAEDMRTDVSLHDDTITPTATDSRTSFDFYKGHATIVNAGIKDQFSKLSPAECRQHCLDEKRFVCQSVASCAYGDCILSHFHGDELLNKTDGKASMSAHSHCAIWTRTWKGMFTLASLLVPKMPPDATIQGVSNEDTCAKECLFGNMTCESFSFCSTSIQMYASSVGISGATAIGRKTTGKFQHECQLFKSHAFDVMHDEREYKPGCWHLSRNYVNDFEQSPGYELYQGVGDTELIKREIEPALERWHCAKECISMLGDDGCLAFDVCDDMASLLVDDINVLASNVSDLISSPNVRCRISSSYVGPQLTNSSQKVRVNENCTLYTRKTYLDGTMINPKTVAAMKRDIRPSMQIPAELRQNPGLLFPNKSGYSVSEMSGLAVGMLIFGVLTTSVCFALWRRSPHARSVTFSPDVPFVRFS